MVLEYASIDDQLNTVEYNLANSRVLCEKIPDTIFLSENERLLSGTRQLATDINNYKTALILEIAIEKKEYEPTFLQKFFRKPVPQEPAELIEKQRILERLNLLAGNATLFVQYVERRNAKIQRNIELEFLTL